MKPKKQPSKPRQRRVSFKGKKLCVFCKFHPPQVVPISQKDRIYMAF